MKVSVFFCPELFILSKDWKIWNWFDFFYPMRNRWEKKMWKTILLSSYMVFKKKKQQHFSIFFETKIVYFILKICTGNRKEENGYWIVLN